MSGELPVINQVKTKIGTVTNTGGTASVGAVLGDAANSSIVTRIAAVKAEVDKIGTISNAGGTATIGGALGPIANQTVVSRLAAIKTDVGRVITSIPSGCFYKATASIQTVSNPAAQNVAHGILEILSGAVTANTYKTTLSITGAGVIYFVANVAMDTTSRTVSMKLIIDGVTVCDEDIASVTAVWGGLTPTPWGVDNIIFNTSLTVQIKSSISETDKVATKIRYALR